MVKVKLVAPVTRKVGATKHIISYKKNIGWLGLPSLELDVAGNKGPRPLEPESGSIPFIKN